MTTVIDMPCMLRQNPPACSKNEAITLASALDDEMIPVKLIMTPVEKVKTVDRDETIRCSATLMREHRISSLLVMKGQDVVGIVTDTDLARRAIADGLDPDRTSVERIMSAPVLEIESETM